MRIILIAAHKNYVLDAPLGDRPIAGADADVMNIWQDRYDDYTTKKTHPGHFGPNEFFLSCL